MSVWRTMARQRWFQVGLGSLVAAYLRLVARTTRSVMEPADAYTRVDADWPVILAIWHGQHFMGPFLRRPKDRATVLVSRHRDGEINAIAAEKLGMETIRGSGDTGGRFDRKGGVGAFQAMRNALRENVTVVQTADVPKIARVAGLGIVMLARASGRPIYPVAVATSRRYVVGNWDRTTVNLPFGRRAAVWGEPVRVPADADDAALEAYRRQVEENLNVATARAYAIVDRKTETESRG